MKSLNLLSIGLYLAVAFLAGCSSLSGLPVDLKDECAYYQQTLGLRYELVDEVSSQLNESLVSFTTNRIEGFDFENEISIFVLKNQFDVYRVYWYRQRIKTRGDYVRADFVEDGILIQWSSRVSRDPGDSKDEEEFVDAEGNHIFDLGPYPLKISDGGRRQGFSRTSQKSFSTEHTKVVLNFGTLFVNGLSYGKLSDGDEIFVDHGNVFISGKKTIGWIPDEYEWRWLYPEAWIRDSTYLNDRLVLYCWKESMSRGKTWFGREWLEAGGIRIEFKKETLFVNKEACVQMTPSDIVLLYRDGVYLLNEELRLKESISNQDLDEALSKGGRIQRVWPSKADIVMKNRIW